MLYACVTYIQSHPKQVVVEETLSYTQDMPELDLSKVESITIGQLIETFDSDDVLMHPNGDYTVDSDYPAGEVLYPIKSFKEAFGGLRRSYTLGGEEMTCKDHLYKYHMDTCTAYYYEGGTLTRGDTYISRETLKTSTLDFASAPNHNGHIKEHVIFSIYGDTEIDAKEVFLGVLEEQPVGDVSFTDNPDGGYSTHWDWQLNMRRIAKELAKKMPKVEFSLRSEDFFCSTYDIVEHNERYIICRRDEKKYIPKVVTTYEIDVTSYKYDEYACTIHNF